MKNSISRKIYEIMRKSANQVVENSVIRIPCEHLEFKKINLECYDKVSPVFIIGPPRSGTTLLYQLLTNKFYFSYINRAMNLFHYSPMLMAKITHLSKLLHKNNMDSKSEYGTITGIMSPDEGGKIWDKILYKKNDTHYIPTGFCSKGQIYEIRKLVIGIKNVLNYPFIGKRPKLSLALPALSEAFPKAIYIAIYREPVYNAQSLYIARQERKRQLDENGWWECKPKEYRKICFLDSIEQSVKQDYYILKQIDADRKLSGHNMVWIKYKDICDKPVKTLEIITSFMKKHDLNLPEREDFVIPAIRSKNERKIELHLFNKIKREVDDVFNGWRPEISNS